LYWVSSSSDSESSICINYYKAFSGVLGFWEQDVTEPRASAITRFAGKSAEGIHFDVYRAVAGEARSTDRVNIAMPDVPIVTPFSYGYNLSEQVSDFGELP